ncbi:PIN domain-containing protein [Xanthomonas campestris]|uniref:PIN domain-containing protein n=2 Tax=Xanthomonas campestris TaxID=339 RepID=UPI001E54C31F|nr:PIN domain-containing protein [Xanthomonas campestris]MCC5074001.1 PIN domain-containing protein [Xanthomonas campestris pv. plantaginis]
MAMQADAATGAHRARTNYVLIDYENVQPTDARLLNRDDVRVWVFVGANQKSVMTDLVTELQVLGTRARYERCSGNGSNALDFHIAYVLGQLSRDDPAGFFHIISKDTGFDPLIAYLKQQKIFGARAASISQMPLFKSMAASVHKAAAAPPPLPASATPLPLMPRALISVPASKASAPAAANQLAPVTLHPAQTSTTPASANTPAPPVKSTAATHPAKGTKPPTAAERLQKIRASLAKMPARARPIKLTSLQNHIAAHFQKAISAAEVSAVIAGLQKAGVLQVSESKVRYC